MKTPTEHLELIRQAIRATDTELDRIATCQLIGERHGEALSEAFVCAKIVVVLLREHELMYGSGGPEPRGFLNA